MQDVAYVRVSTERQSKYGKGLDGQKRQIRAYCKAEELKIHSGDRSPS
jgi:DNA invertase Pin-like site-specific DNA recombinase